MTSSELKLAPSPSSAGSCNKARNTCFSCNGVVVIVAFAVVAFVTSGGNDKDRFVVFEVVGVVVVAGIVTGGVVDMVTGGVVCGKDEMDEGGRMGAVVVERVEETRKDCC